jgi:hypothetical protein
MWKIDKIMKVDKIFPLIFYGPPVMGSIIGASYSGYTTYQETKTHDFKIAYAQVVTETLIGSTVGLIGGTFWFLAVPMYIGRTYEGISFDGRNKYTIYKRK